MSRVMLRLIVRTASRALASVWNGASSVPGFVSLPEGETKKAGSSRGTPPLLDAPLLEPPLEELPLVDELPLLEAPLLEVPPPLVPPLLDEPPLESQRPWAVHGALDGCGSSPQPNARSIHAASVAARKPRTVTGVRRETLRFIPSSICLGAATLLPAAGAAGGEARGSLGAIHVA